MIRLGQSRTEIQPTCSNSDSCSSWTRRIRNPESSSGCPESGRGLEIDRGDATWLLVPELVDEYPLPELDMMDWF